jgi:hypothetical protein
VSLHLDGNFGYESELKTGKQVLAPDPTMDKAPKHLIEEDLTDSEPKSSVQDIQCRIVMKYHHL